MANRFLLRPITDFIEGLHFDVLARARQRMERAHTLSSQGKVSEAEQLYKMALDALSGSNTVDEVQVKRAYARLLFRAGRPDECLALQTTIKMIPLTNHANPPATRECLNENRSGSSSLRSL